MSAATEQQNNGDVAVEKVAADADDLKSQKAAVEDGKPAAADNGTASKDEVHDEDTAPAKEHVKGTKRPADGKNSESKKAKKEKAPDADSDDEIDSEGNVVDSEIESDEYDIPYDGEEDDIECEDDDDDENDDGSGSDDQA